MCRDVSCNLIAIFIGILIAILVGIGIATGFLGGIALTLITLVIPSLLFVIFLAFALVVAAIQANSNSSLTKCLCSNGELIIWLNTIGLILGLITVALSNVLSTVAIALFGGIISGILVATILAITCLILCVIQESCCNDNNF